MRILLQLMTAILSVTILSGAYAAKAPPTTFGGTAIPSPASSGQVMSGDTYKGTVDKMGQETQKNLHDTVQKQVKSGTSMPPAKSSSTLTPPPQTQPSDVISESADQTDSTNTTTTSSSTSTNTQPTSSSISAPPSSQPPTSNQPYTGFGGGQSKEKGSNTSGGQSGKSGGWNVGY